MMIIAKVIRIPGDTAQEIAETCTLLQDCVEKINPNDLKALLRAVKKNPNLVRTALKFV